MHVCHSDNTRYHLQQDGKKRELKSVTEERDLGITITSDLKVSRQRLNAVSKAHKELGMVSRQFRNLDKASFLILYKGFIRPHLEYALGDSFASCMR